MQDFNLLIAVGAPGSGKTHFLQGLQANGQIDEVLADGLESDETWPRVISRIRMTLHDGGRIGVCGQTFSTMKRRHRLESDFRGDPAVAIRYEFFEPDYRACLINVIKDALAGNKLAWHRACCIYAMNKEGRFEIPHGVIPRQVFARPITQEEVDKFFCLIPTLGRPFSPEGEAWLRKTVWPQPDHVLISR